MRELKCGGRLAETLEHAVEGEDRRDWRAAAADPHRRRREDPARGPHRCPRATLTVGVNAQEVVRWLFVSSSLPTASSRARRTHFRLTSENCSTSPRGACPGADAHRQTRLADVRYRLRDPRSLGARLRDPRRHATRGHRASPSGHVGDENQLVAIEDALAQFSADAIVVVGHVPGQDNWHERTRPRAARASCLRGPDNRRRGGDLATVR